MERLRKVFQGKVVHFVGTAPNIEGKGLGKEIDAGDIVYRTNIIPRNTADYGSRTDVISILEHAAHAAPPLAGLFVVTFDPIDGIASDFVAAADLRATISLWALDSYSIDLGEPTAGIVAWYLAHFVGSKRFKMFGVTGYQNKAGEVVNHCGYNHYTKETFDLLGPEIYGHAQSVDMAHYEFHDFAACNRLVRRLLADGLLELDPFSEEYFR